jgi:selenocysteine lyase/cysteine desulfurase
MTHLDPKKFYQRFLKGHEGTLHFAAHSHHFWPDVTREAHLEYWDDCAKLSDQKWSKIFTEVIPKAQKHIADILNLKHEKQIVFAPNTHELTARLLSLFLGKKSLTILTTSSEFYSWRRQILRLMEYPQVQVTTIPTTDLLHQREKFLEEVKLSLKKNPDLFFISQVFFDSGLALTDEELLDLSASCSDSTIMVVDGYHGFGAIPTNLSKLEGKIFYLGGGYKYAQAGEGVGFMVVPQGDWRPAYTGWFAEYGSLKKPQGTLVGYTDDGSAFFGATQDPSGLYRFNGVWDLFKKEGLGIGDIHTYVTGLQRTFCENLPDSFLKNFHLTPLFSKDLNWHGHFLTFEAPSEPQASMVEETLKNLGILIDRRGSRLRFGFGLYQDKADVERSHVLFLMGGAHKEKNMGPKQT